MDTIDKWLKSLRLHKYTHLFKSLTYDQMLNLEEKYLIERDVTKGARNKMLVSVRKLNLRQERLINMIDDLNQDNISMKEALTVLKDMLITPIPPPPTKQNKIHHHLHHHHHHHPYELTYLFIETLEKVAQQLIESAGMEDNACHGIMAAIVDECLKHNSFTKEQKAKVASFKQHFFKEQKAKAASFKQQSRQRPHSYNNHHYQQQNHYYQNNLNYISYNDNDNQQIVHQLPLQQQQQLQQPQQLLNPYVSQQQIQLQLLKNQSLQQQPQYQFHQANYDQHCHYFNNHWNGPIEPPSIPTSPSRMSGSACLSGEEELVQQQQLTQQKRKQKQHQQQKDHQHHHQQLLLQQEQRQAYKEYSLLGPGMTFELPCLRASAVKHDRQSKSSY